MAASSASCKCSTAVKFGRWTRVGVQNTRGAENLQFSTEITLSGFLHSHIIRYQWNPISCGMHVRKRFCSDHWRRWRSKPGSWIVGSTTKVELTTIADCQSSLHRLVTSIDCKSLHSGLRDSRWSGGGWKTSLYIMANHGDIQPALSTCLWQLCIVELVVQYLWERATMVMELTGRCQRWGAWRNAVGHLQG